MDRRLVTAGVRSSTLRLWMFGVRPPFAMRAECCHSMVSERSLKWVLTWDTAPSLMWRRDPWRQPRTAASYTVAAHVSRALIINSGYYSGRVGQSQPDRRST